MTNRQLTPIDRLLSSADNALRTLFAAPAVSRPSPAGDIEDSAMSDAEKRHVAGLMRVNHAGEVAAQALYQGHAVTARDAGTRRRMQLSATEEVDHLSWCRERIEQLGDRVSLLDPFWYAGSFTIGLAAGIAGDRWNLGFVAETERQVVRHLDSHLGQLPAGDAKSRAILEQMREDELQHANAAIDSGAADFPPALKWVMHVTSRAMTKTAYRI